MLRRLLSKIFGSVHHSRHNHHYNSSSGTNRHGGRSYSSGHQSGYGHKNQGQGYYKNRYKRSSS